MPRPARGGVLAVQLHFEIRSVPQPGEAVDHRFFRQQLDEVAGAERGPYPGTQLGGVERFGHVIGRAQVQPADLVLLRREPGEKDDRDFTREGIGFEVAADDESARIRHVDVEQDQVGLPLAGHRHAGHAVVGRLNDDVLVIEPHLHQRVNLGRIVDDQNLVRHGRALVRVDSLRPSESARSVNRIRGRPFPAERLVSECSSTGRQPG